MKIKYFIFILIPIIQFYCSTGLQNTQKHQHPPEWYLNPPKAEDTIFGIGFAKSKIEMLAQDKADYQARSDISNNIENRVLQLYKSYILEDNFTLITIDNPKYNKIMERIKRESLVGSAIINHKVTSDKDYFYVYSLCRLDNVSIVINKLFNKYFIQNTPIELPNIPNKILDFEELLKEFEK